MSRPVVVLCNGATARRLRNRQRLELEYRPGVRPEHNIVLKLPKFIESLLHLPDRVLDLLEIAAYIFAADRLVSRGRTDDLVYDAWSRSFEFHVRVRDVTFWNDPRVQRRLTECLAFMTGDADYCFQFEGGHSTLPTNLFDSEGISIPVATRPSIQLFSGGLDSLAGAIQLLDRGQTVCLVSHRSQPGTMRTQTALTQALAAHAAYRGRVWPYYFDCTLRGLKAVEETQRSRAFLYTSIAFALQTVFGTSEVYVFENGITGLNLPRREDQSRARASRTTHPKTMRLLESLFSLVAARPICLVQPFLWKTKRDVLELIKASGHESLVSSSVSCSETRSSRGPAAQCGTCFQCVDRRIAAFASGMTDVDHDGLYSLDVNREPLKGRARTVVVDYIRQAHAFVNTTADSFQQQHAPELVDICEGLEPLPEVEAVDRVWRLCVAHGCNVLDALRFIRLKLDDPFAKIVPNSLPDLVSNREYFKDPVERAVATFAHRVEPQIERLYAAGGRPKNEPEFNRAVGAILGAICEDLRSEHPAARFACAGVVPDHELNSSNVLIESKYVRKGTPPSKVTEGIGADLTKYPAHMHILFIVYDPEHQIPDTKVFVSDFESRGRCTVRVLR